MTRHDMIYESRKFSLARSVHEPISLALTINLSNIGILCSGYSRGPAAIRSSIGAQACVFIDVLQLRVSGVCMYRLTYVPCEG